MIKLRSLREIQALAGASFASDGIPLHYGDLTSEYHRALNQVVLMDRSHEGRLELLGRDRIALIQRTSTNDMLNMALDEGRPTIFTNPNGRILDRIMLYNRGETALVITEAGRGRTVGQYIQGSIFFNDDIRLHELAPATHLFVLHGPNADAVVTAVGINAAQVPPLHGRQAAVAGTPVYFARRKPISGSHWLVVAPLEAAPAVWSALVAAGAPHGLAPAGSLAYNVLRIRAGRPAVGRELSADYIPLEAGLWDEVSFTKGCYTGQEIIARMESRGRLAKTLVTLRLTAPVEPPAPLLHAGKAVGMLTSAVTTPDDEILGIGFVRPTLALPGEVFVMVGREQDADTATVIERAGTQPPHLADQPAG